MDGPYQITLREWLVDDIAPAGSIHQVQKRAVVVYINFGHALKRQVLTVGLCGDKRAVFNACPESMNPFLEKLQ